MTRILGLDISTSTIGISVIDFDPQGKATLIHTDYYKPVKGTLEDRNYDFLHTLREAKRKIIDIIREYKPEEIAVEDFIKFMKGGSGAATIIPLATLNRTICLAISETYSQTPLHICNVISIRTRIKKACGLKDLPKKEDLPELLEHLLGIVIPRPLKKTRKGSKIMEEHFDMTDAIAVAFYCHKIINEKK